MGKVLDRQDTWKGSAWAPWTQNLYAYVGNNPVNWIDPTGHTCQDTEVNDIDGECGVTNQTGSGGPEGDPGSSALSDLEVKRQKLSELGYGCNWEEWSTFCSAIYDGLMGDASIGIAEFQADNQWTVDLAGLFILAQGAVDVYRSSGISLASERGSFPIWRLGRATASNLTPRPKDTNGLSFLIDKGDREGVSVFMESVNQTGVLVAVRDGANHVSVRPVDMSRMQEWINSRPTAWQNPHEFTRLLMELLNK